jgi:hypothetical protein
MGSRSRLTACWALVLALALAGCAGSGRTVQGRQLTSPARPEMVLVAGEGFHYIGQFGYALAGGFQGERYIFADTAGRALRRLLIVQFEQISGSTEVYHYNLENGETIGGLRFLTNTFAFPGVRAPVTHPRDEAERTDNFLLARGYTMPAVWLTTRFVTLGADDRKSEMIVFFMEGHDNLRMSDLYAGEDPTLSWQAMKPELARRGRAAFTIGPKLHFIN